MLWILDDAPRKNVRERFRRHHSAGERVNPSRARRRIVNRLAVENEWDDFLEQLHPRHQAARSQRAPIVNLANLYAQSPDVDRKFPQQFFPAKFVNHPERLLGFAEREDRHEHAAAGAERAIYRFRQPPFLGGASESFRQRTVPTRCLDDQNIHAGFRKARARGYGLIVKVNVAGIKNRPALRA